jgi:hypothetical protein
MTCHSTPGEGDPDMHFIGCIEEKNLLSVLRFEPQFPDCPTYSLVPMLTELFRFQTWRV